MDDLVQSFRQLIQSPIAIVALIFLLGMYPLGTTGLWIRKGVETKKALNNIQNKNNAWHEANRKATLYIWGPIAGWVIGYVLIFLYTSPLEFFFSFLGLIIPIFGYQGKRFWLTSE